MKQCRNPKCRLGYRDARYMDGSFHDDLCPYCSVKMYDVSRVDLGIENGFKKKNAKLKI